VSQYGDLYIRLHRFVKAGDVHRGHQHKIDHVTVVCRGTVRVRFGPEGREVREYKAPALIEIDKDVFHQLTALEDETMYFCVFSTAGIDALEQASMCDGCDGSGCGKGTF
jgi:quercetin dioxygenase-like cupin family protein